MARISSSALPLGRRQTAAPKCDLASRTDLAWRAWALALMALWMLALAAGPELLRLGTAVAGAGAQWGVHGLALGQAHVQPFADGRRMWGLPNAMDVFSNLSFLLAGVGGLMVWRRSHLPAATRRAALAFLLGLLCTSLTSAFYHWAPDATGLAWDRLGMAIAFAGALALAVAERVGQGAADRTLAVVLVAASVSAVLPLFQGNVLPWVVVQFGGMTFIVWAATRRPAAGAVGIQLGWLIVIYALAKLLEVGDAAVFANTGEVVSGHSLKHIVAGLAVWPVMAAMSSRCPRRHALGAAASAD